LHRPHHIQAVIFEPPQPEPEPEVPQFAPIEDGHGKYVFQDGSWYEGEWQKGGEIGEHVRRHGKGVMVDGEQSYEGSWVNDKIHGSGIFRYASKAKYEGEWVENLYGGKGKYTWPSGAYYEGEWLNNKMHGTGVYIDEKGTTWEGRFYNGVGPGLCEAV